MTVPLPVRNPVPAHRRAHPSKLFVEVTTRCNLRCAMCVKYAPGQGLVEGDMAEQTFERLAPAFPHLEALVLNGIGEPLLHRGLERFIERAKADRVLATAARLADSFKVKFTPHVVTARQAGKAIVDEAVERRSEVIILGTMRKRRIGNLVFGRTADYVLDHAPCEVLLNLVPKDYPTEGSAAFDSEPQAPGPKPPAPDGGRQAPPATK